MIYTDGVGTIANVREDHPRGKKVHPHKAYRDAIIAHCDDIAIREDRPVGASHLFRAIHPGDDD